MQHAIIRVVTAWHSLTVTHATHDRHNIQSTLTQSTAWPFISPLARVLRHPSTLQTLEVISTHARGITHGGCRLILCLCSSRPQGLRLLAGTVRPLAARPGYSAGASSKVSARASGACTRAVGCVRRRLAPGQIRIPMWNSAEVRAAPLAADFGGTRAPRASADPPAPPCSGWRRATAGPAPRIRSQCRFRNRGTDYLSESGIKWTSGSAKGQCDRARPAPASPPARAPQGRCEPPLRSTRRCPRPPPCLGFGRTAVSGRDFDDQAGILIL
jgi:hypothetical protein